MNVNNLSISKESSAAEVAEILLSIGVSQTVIININNEIICAHPQAQFLVEIIKEEWRDHEALFIKVDEQTECIYIVSIHSSVRGRSEGGVRILSSPGFIAGVNDCMALSFGMTKKSAYADIWAGGGKSVIIPYSERIFSLLMKEQAKNEREITGTFRELMWRNYGGFVAQMQGAFIIGEDMFVNSWDMRTLQSFCIHTSCHSKLVGGAENPSPKTALGIYKAMMAVAEVVMPQAPSLKDKKIIIKGVGLVGYSLAELLYKAGAKLIIYDTDPKAAERITQLGDDIEMHIFSRREGESESEFTQRFKIEELQFLDNTTADIYSPNARSKTLSRELIEVLHVKAIAGAENAQIAKDDEAYVVARLAELGIVCVPDAAINSMGIFSAYQEHIGIIKADFDKKADAIYVQTRELLTKAVLQGKTPHHIFIETALMKAMIPHPIFGHRGIEIIKEVFEAWK